MTVQRALFDRTGHLRAESGILESLRSSGESKVIVVREGRARVHEGGLVTVAPAEVGDDAQWAILGRRSDGSALLLAATEPMTDSIDAAPAETWLGLRDTGGLLDPESTELLVTAVSLASWLREARFCQGCGAETVLGQGGWARRCDACAHDIFPRTDPAVIVAVESADGDRLLLGANANWRGTMYSCFAGFVEAGESLETTVHREIEEEAGVRLDEIRYVSSQPWPYPRSLMIGFRATASDSHPARADGEEIIDVRWFTRDEIRSALNGDGPVGLPGPASIARSLIEQWCEERSAPGPARESK